ESVKRYVDYIFDFLMRARNPDEAYLMWLSRHHGELAAELAELAKALGVVKETQAASGEA
ncbi:MAG: hypothetical protein LM580_08935, partial [Thermofilum sp.]|nr:hypothetical protein [Thermofilum sp.]